MVSSTRQAIAGILVIFGVAMFARAQTFQPKEPTATISGKITIKGKGAPGIFIGLRRQESSYPRQLTGYKAVTDTDGKYRIENVSPGAYVVIPVAPAFISDEMASERVLIVNKDETIENIDFVLLRGGAITGKVVDADGRPLIEEEVSAFPEPENMRAHSRYLGTRTDDRGIYRIFGLPPGRYRVATGSEGLSSRYQRASYKRTYHPGVEDLAQATVIEISEGSEAINIDFTLGGTITTYTASGRIVDGQTGQPMPNVSYGVTRYYGEHNSSSTSSGVVSNSRGEFRLENLSPGKYAVSAADRANGEWHADEVRFEVTDQDVTGLVIKTEKAAVISGIVVLDGTDDKSAREQLSRLHLVASVMNEVTRRGFGASAMVAQDGTFRITGLAGGTASFFVASSPQFRIVRVERNGVIQPRGIDIKPGEQIAGVRVVVNYGNASIRGVVTLENGTLPPGGQFYVWVRKLGDDPNAPPSSSNASLQLDARGQFVIENLMPGAYELQAGVALPEARKSLVTKKQEVVVTAGSTSNVTITLDLKSTTARP
jgi:hypothetical protein